MHVIVSRNALLEVLGAASGVAATRTTKEVLKCVRLTTKDSTLVVSATDLEVALRVEVRQVEVKKKKGDLLIPADKLMQIARESVDDTLTLESEDQVCHIRGKDSHFEIYGQDPKDFPPVPALEGPPDLEVEGPVLFDLINKTLFSVAKENTRYAINGVLWQKQGKKLILVSTDGRRLARAVGPADGPGADAQMIVPAKTVQVVQRVLAHIEGKVGVKFSPNQIIVQADSYMISSALVEGHFPQYDDVIPKDSDKKVELNAEDFHSAVKRAALLTNEQSKGVRLAFDKGQLVLSSRAPEQGEATISMSVEYPGPAIEIGFNPLFLTEALRVVGGPSISLEMKDSNRPGVFRVGQVFLYVVMPVNLA